MFVKFLCSKPLSILTDNKGGIEIHHQLYKNMYLNIQTHMYHSVHVILFTVLNDYMFKILQWCAFSANTEILLASRLEKMRLQSNYNTAMCCQNMFHSEIYWNWDLQHCLAALGIARLVLTVLLALPARLGLPQQQSCTHILFLFLMYFLKIKKKKKPWHVVTSLFAKQVMPFGNTLRNKMLSSLQMKDVEQVGALWPEGIQLHRWSLDCI